MSVPEQLITLARGKFDFLLPVFIRKGFFQHGPRPLPSSAHQVALTHGAPLISIVIPSYNMAQFLEGTIISVLDQRYPRLELIVVDGGSTDGSAAIIEKYRSRLHWWCSESDHGQAHAINKGFSRANGEILAWLNADDRYLEGTLARVANYLGARRDVDVVYGHRLLVDEDDRMIGRWVLPPHSDRVLSWADFIPQETMFWRRRVWNKVGCRVDASLDFAMDWDLLLRFRDAKARMVRLPYCLGLFRIHSGQKTSSRIDQVGFKEMQKLRKRSLGYVPSSARRAVGVAWYLMKARLFEILYKNP